jgi:hypothetical protein
MSLKIEISEAPNNILLDINPIITIVEANLALPYAGANAIEKTPEIYNLEVVAALPGAPDDKTIYFIVP